MTRPVIIDCDPGQDDAVNLLLALSAPEELDVVAITTVAGNVPLDKTSRNARIVAELAGRSDLPVYAGCAEPLMRRLVTAEYVHGREGIDGMELFEPSRPLEDAHAVDFLVERLMAAPDDSVTLVPTGPLTNVAAALAKQPAIAGKIREVVLMGGAMREGGNVTPAAEFNIYVDPHAARIVLGCGRPLVVLGLDVTHQVLATPARVEALSSLGNRAGREVSGMLEFSGRYDIDKYGAPGAPLHDPCTAAYLLAPELFRTRRVNIEVEIESELTMGATVVDYWGVTGRKANALWVDGVEADGFFELLTRALGRLP